MKSFVTRALSAVTAVAILLTLHFFSGPTGYKALVFIAVLLGGFELAKILFKSEDSRLNRSVFYLFNFCIFGLSVLHPAQAAIIFSFFAICFCLVSLTTQRKFENLEALSSFQAKSVLGFFYMGLLPSFAAQLLTLPNGAAWFLTLLAVVFAGDTGAYLSGMLFGRTKLMPSVSPKKTVEGAIGGLLCSMAVGTAAAVTLDHSVPALLLLSAAAGVIAQFGDLFESLLKRVADVKDSGRIMPGHGGVLDRIDGVLFASPIILFGAILLENRLVLS